MTTTAERVPGRDRLISRALLLRFVSIVGASASFYLPLSVVPLYARSAGANAAAGLATGTLLLATVAVELLTPRLVAATGYRLALSLGLLALGLPALALLAPPSLAVIVAVSVVRGAGFAVLTVAGGSLTASLIPPRRRGEGLALTGVVSGVPALACLPLGVWMSARWGFAPVFVLTASAAVLGLLSVPWLPERERAGRGTATARAPRLTAARGVLSALATPSLTGPAALFSASTVAAGVLVTFLPLAITQRSAAVATIALFAQPAVATLARLAAGRLGDRRGHAGLLYPGIGLAASGMAAIAATGTPILVIAGAAVFGAGFGLLQNATLALMYARTGAGGYDAVSALWNAAYDAGMGAGAIGMGLIAGLLGYPATFLLTAGLVLPALVPASRAHGTFGKRRARQRSEAYDRRRVRRRGGGCGLHSDGDVAFHDEHRVADAAADRHLHAGRGGAGADRPARLRAAPGRRRGQLGALRGRGIGKDGLLVSLSGQIIELTCVRVRVAHFSRC